VVDFVEFLARMNEKIRLRSRSPQTTTANMIRHARRLTRLRSTGMRRSI